MRSMRTPRSSGGKVGPRQESARPWPGVIPPRLEPERRNRSQRRAAASAPTPAPPDVAPFAARRREALSEQFPGTAIVVPAGAMKVRANDTDYGFRAASSFTWLTGETVTDAVHRDRNRPHVVLNFITPHQKWGIHSTYTDNLLMLTLSRGGPIVWISEIDARKAGIEDNDWIEAYNVNGALTARAVVSQRVKEGMALMYHAQEKIVNVPGSEITGQRGGIHNSVTRAIIKPTHMIGGYAQLSYGFNYYGTVGSNRDEFVIVRKLDKIDWLEGPLRDGEVSKGGRS